MTSAGLRAKMKITLAREALHSDPPSSKEWEIGMWVDTAGRRKIVNSCASLDREIDNIISLAMLELPTRQRQLYTESQLIFY